MTAETTHGSADRELVLIRILNAPRENVFRCWTEPALIRQWFAPHPYTTPSAEMDLRPGGSTRIVMRDPQGNDLPNPGVILEVVKNERLVFTDAYTSAWQPSPRPFMTVVLTLEDAGPGRTRYTARALHWSVEDREEHEKMGFEAGWGLCAQQLEAPAATL